MEAFIFTILGLIILALIGQLVKCKYKIKQLNRDNITLGDIINKSTVKTTEIDKELNVLETKYINLVKEITSLEDYLKTFINGKLKVYVHSNFHSNYNLYNGKFYAKVNAANSGRSKAEGIPVLPLQDSKYSVIDIYKLKKLLRLFPERGLLANLNESKTLKESMIQELGNKTLTPYSK